MKTPSEEDINNSLEILNKINAGMAATRESIIKNARFHNTPIISWQDGKIVEIDPFSIELEEDKKK